MRCDDKVAGCGQRVILDQASPGISASRFPVWADAQEQHPHVFQVSLSDQCRPALSGVRTFHTSGLLESRPLKSEQA